MSRYRFSLLLTIGLMLFGATFATAQQRETATFAGGCFWCMEEAFDHVPGVISTTSGYTGGDLVNPSYMKVSSGSTGHVEAVQVVYDPDQVDYNTLLKVFWRNIDPTVSNRQFCDGGDQYRAEIFTHNDTQRKLALASKQELNANRPFRDPVVTRIVDAKAFYPAEEYHQDYHIKNPIRYKTYKFGCGRMRKLRQLWGDEAGGPFHG